MKRGTMPLVLLMLMVALLVAAVPTFGAPPHAVPISGLECVYLDTPGQMEITGQMIHVIGQVNRNDFYSDDPTVFPNATTTAVLDIVVNMKSGMVFWRATAVSKPDGYPDSAFKGTGGGWFRTDPVTGEVYSKGLVVLHGTGALEGQTLKAELARGDIAQCPEAPNSFDATVWNGFLVPPAP